MIKRAASIVTLLLGCSCSHVSNALLTNSGASRTIVTTPLAQRTISFSNTALNEQQGGSSDEILYSFGAEVVPEGQRPVNEYLDMKGAPLFGWGSNEVGLEGLLIRLGIVYAITFVLV